MLHLAKCTTARPNDLCTVYCFAIRFTSRDLQGIVGRSLHFTLHPFPTLLHPSLLHIPLPFPAFLTSSHCLFISPSFNLSTLPALLSSFILPLSMETQNSLHQSHLLHINHNNPLRKSQLTRFQDRMGLWHSNHHSTLPLSFLCLVKSDPVPKAVWCKVAQKSYWWLWLGWAVRQNCTWWAEAVSQPSWAVQSRVVAIEPWVNCTNYITVSFLEFTSRPDVSSLPRQKGGEQEWIRKPKYPWKGLVLLLLLIETKAWRLAILLWLAYNLNNGQMAFFS